MLPRKIKESWDRVNKKIDEFIESDYDHSFRMLFITDVHIGAEMANHIHQYNYVKKLIKFNNVDFILNGGDIGLDVGETDAKAKKVIKKTIKATNYSVPYFCLKGNHDFKESIISNRELAIKLNYYFINKISNEIGKIYCDTTDSGGYGFYVDKKTDTKFIFLNTSETYRNYEISKEQLKFLIEQLEKTTEKRVVICSHFCISECGSWNRYPAKYSDNMLCLKRIESDFAKKKSGAINDLEWDFTKSNTEFLLHLSGDSHFTNQSKDDGYLITCRQGYGGIDDIDVPKGAFVDKFDVNELCNFDILVINKNGGAKLFRVGAGENDRDLDIK